MDEDAAAHESRSAALVEAISDRLDGRVVACAESVTSGRLSAALAAPPGAAQWFRGGLVSYQTTVKRSLLGVRSASVLCEDAAVEMAQGVLRLLDADVSVATTGVAGQDPQDGVAPGTVFVATVVDGAVRTATYRFDGVGPSMCDAATTAALAQLLVSLNGREPGDRTPDE